jgi:hypothetical protein
MVALNQLLFAARDAESGKAVTLLAICAQTASVT